MRGFQCCGKYLERRVGLARALGTEGLALPHRHPWASVQFGGYISYMSPE